MLLGFVTAWYAYIRDTTIPGQGRRAARPGLHASCINKWYFDELYNYAVRRAGVLARPACSGSAATSASSTASAPMARPGWSRRARSPRSASSRAISTSYALVMLLGLVAAVTWVMVISDERLSDPFRDAAGAAGRRAGLPVLRSEGGAHDRAGRHAGRSRARHRAVGQLRHRRRAVAVHRARADLRRASSGRSASTASR